MKRLFIEPLDVLMFRSERPFTARESHMAKLGVISPLTFEGAIKSKILSELCKEKNYLLSDFQRKKNEDKSSFKERIKKMLEKDAELKKEFKKILEAIGHPVANSASSIQVLGVFYSQKEKGEEWFPVPNDIVKKDEDNEILKLTPILKEELKIPDTENYACFSSYLKIEEMKGLMSFNALKDYLWGGKPDRSQIMEDPYTTELRMGIQLKKGTKTTVEGHMYMAEFLRLKNWKENWGFIIWYESPIDITNGFLKLGGEGKGAVCTKMNEIDLTEKLRISELIEQINREKGFKLYLASPSYFNGHDPPRDRLEKKLGIKELKLRATLPGRPVYVGGYDFAMNMEKPLRRWVNAGAVYYYEFDGEIKSDLNLPIKIIINDTDMRCAFIGRWKNV